MMPMLFLVFQAAIILAAETSIQRSCPVAPMVSPTQTPPGMALNRTTLDIDTGPPRIGVNYNHTSAHQGMTLSFNAQGPVFRVSP